MPDSELTNRRGVNLAEEMVLNAGHFFRSQDVSDYGVDAQIEIKDDRSATGRLIAVQIKSGTSYFSNEVEAGFWH